jgi:hypothetical protein
MKQLKLLFQPDGACSSAIFMPVKPANLPLVGNISVRLETLGLAPMPHRFDGVL